MKNQYLMTKKNTLVGQTDDPFDVEVCTVMRTAGIPQ